METPYRNYRQGLERVHMDPFSIQKFTLSKNIKIKLYTVLMSVMIYASPTLEYAATTLQIIPRFWKS